MVGGEASVADALGRCELGGAGMEPGDVSGYDVVGVWCSCRARAWRSLDSLAFRSLMGLDGTTTRSEWARSERGEARAMRFRCSSHQLVLPKPMRCSCNAGDRPVITPPGGSVMAM